MATNLPTNVPTNPMTQFDTVATQIHQTFDPLIAQLIARRDALLLKLSQLRQDYSDKETTRRAAIEELEKTQQQMMEMSLKVNVNLPIHQQATALYKQGLKQLETPTKLPYPTFMCPKLQELQSIITEFGKVREWDVPDYSLKKEPVVTAGKYGNGDTELRAAGIAIDDDVKLIFIADYLNSRVQIVSFEGHFMTRFGQDTLKYPWGIIVSKEHIFITDIGLHALLKFDRNSYKLVIRTGIQGSEDGQFNNPLGLCINYNGDVLVADNNNNRVSVFSKDLIFISNIGIGHLKFPKDVKLTPDSVVVVLNWSPKCVHFYSKNGYLLNSCISQGQGPDCLVNLPTFFCFDLAGNIIISDRGNHTIRIFSQSEQLIHTIGREGEEIGEFMEPYGICISKLGTIFIVSHNPNFSIQCY